MLSCSVSLDGYLGDRTPRFALSNAADFERVDEVRASCERRARGLASSPMKITVTDRVDLDARSNFFTTGEAEKLVYTSSPRVALADRGGERLMVEGGDIVHTQFLADDLVDELQLVVAPFFVGDSSAPRFVSDGRFP
jgi:5-amino-6-(5-phosphoribosylamino)uracil reductase